MQDIFTSHFTKRIKFLKSNFLASQDTKILATDIYLPNSTSSDQQPTSF